MTGSFVVDESSWIRANPSDPTFGKALQDFIDLVDAIREKNIPLYRHSDIHSTYINNDIPIYSFLWESQHGDLIGHDGLELISLAFDRCLIIDEAEFALDDYVATIDGSEYLSPGTCWAHLRSKSGVSVSPVALYGLGGINKHRVEVGGNAQEIFFTFKECDIQLYFRHAALFERFDEATLKDYAGHAFPRLDWTDDAWQGLKVHKGLILGKHYDDTFKHLCVLNDVGCEFFCRYTDNEEISRNLSAVGVSASTENGNTRQDNAARIARTKRYKNEDHEFWWHTKLSWNAGRIHFKHMPPKDSGCGVIVIGLITDHAC